MIMDLGNMLDIHLDGGSIDDDDEAEELEDAVCFLFLHLAKVNGLMGAVDAMLNKN